MNLVNYIYLATILFAIGGATVLMRRNAIVVFMGVELMLNATNLVFVTFARMRCAARLACVGLGVSRSRWASTIAPSTAVISRALVASKAKT